MKYLPCSRPFLLWGSTVLQKLSSWIVPCWVLGDRRRQVEGWIPWGRNRSLQLWRGFLYECAFRKENPYGTATPLVQWDGDSLGNSAVSYSLRKLFFSRVFMRLKAWIEPADHISPWFGFGFEWGWFWGRGNCVLLKATIIATSKVIYRESLSAQVRQKWPRQCSLLLAMNCRSLPMATAEKREMGEDSAGTQLLSFLGQSLAINLQS